MVAEEPADASGDASAGSVRMDELWTLLEEIERRKPPPIALRPGASLVVAAVPYLLCLLVGWLAATRTSTCMRYIYIYMLLPHVNVYASCLCRS